MARQIHWQVPFVALNGTSYTINIYEEDYTGSIVTLKGGAEPFVTDEEDDNDMMLPLRTSTGNINIVATEPLDIFATGIQSHYVTLMSGTSMIWQGYLQPTANDITWGPYPQEVQFPVVSCLGSLNDVEMPDTDFSLKTLRELLYEAITASGGVYWRIAFPGEWTSGGSGSQFGLLNAQISRYTFFDKVEMAADSPEFKRYEANTYGQMLTKILDFLGWSIYEHNSVIFLTTPNCTQYKSTSIVALTQSNPTISTATAEAIDLPEVRSTRNSQSIVAPNRSITLSANAKANTESLISITTEGNDIRLDRRINTSHPDFDTWGVEAFGGRMAVGYTTVVNKEIFDIITHQYTLEYNQDSDDEPIYLYEIIEQDMPAERLLTMVDGGHDYDSEQSLQTHMGAQIFRWDLDDTDAYNTKRNLSYADCLAVVVSTPFDRTTDPLERRGLSEEVLKAHPLVTFRSKEALLLNNGVICIKLEAFKNYGNGNFWARIRIGDKYYHRGGIFGGQWTTEENWIEINTGQNDKTRWNVYEEFNDASGIILDCNDSTTLSGNIIIDLVPRISNIQNFSCMIGDFSVNLMLRDLYGNKEREDANVYYGKMNNDGDALQKELDILTMDNNQVCHNCLWYDQRYLTTQMVYKGENARPETVLVNKIKEAYGKPRQVIDVTVALSELPPINFITFDGQTYEILSRSYSYRDSTVTLKLIETSWQN